jgi:acetoin utilization transport system permease protein
MLNRTLWKMHYKQAKYLLWVYVAISLLYPLNIYITNDRYLTANEPSLVILNFSASEWVSALQVLCLIALAATLQGLERTNQSMDFSLALPFKRKDILLSKWSIGVITIVAVNLVSLLLTSAILLSSELLPFIPYQLFLFYFFTSTVFLIGIYSLCLFVGLLVGNFSAQFALSLIVLYLPFAYFIFIYLGSDSPLKYILNFDKSSFLFNIGKVMISMPVFLSTFDHEVMIPKQATSSYEYYVTAFATPVIITILYVSLVNFFAKKIISEHNGRFLLSRKLEPIFTAAVVICSYLFGGILFSIFDTSTSISMELLWFHFGGSMFGLISYFIATRLVGRNLLFRKKAAS